MDPRQSVRFYLNGVLREVMPSSPTLTVLQYLREQARLTGTKEGCAEGDCGACTITEASLNARDEVEYRAINACIRFLPTVDGKALWTVEAVAGPEGQLHPVQQAMVDHHGSQCGFCTPGFIMSMYTMYKNGMRRPVRAEVLDNLSGNLCRCTGYRPIIDAALSMGNYPDVASDTATVTKRLKELRGTRRVSLGLGGSDQTYEAPTTIDELSARYMAVPAATLLAGGTDLGLLVTKQLKTLNHIIYLGDVQELDKIERRTDHLYIGATVLLNDGYRAIVEEYPEATEMWKRFASMPIRSSGTLVGNLANGSPIGDTAPFLIAVGAQVVLRRGTRERTLALEDLYLDYGKQDREPGEWVMAVLIPSRQAGTHVATYKLSKRFDQDISAVCSAYALRLEHGKVAGLRIAHGGMAATTRRAHHAEKALNGGDWCESSITRAMSALEQDYQPLTDMRATGGYRLQAAQNLLYRFFLESTGTADTRV